MKINDLKIAEFTNEEKVVMREYLFGIVHNGIEQETEIFDFKIPMSKCGMDAVIEYIQKTVGSDAEISKNTAKYIISNIFLIAFSYINEFAYGCIKLNVSKDEKEREIINQRIQSIIENMNIFKEENQSTSGKLN